MAFEKWTQQIEMFFLLMCRTDRNFIFYYTKRKIFLGQGKTKTLSKLLRL